MNISVTLGVVALVNGPAGRALEAGEPSRHGEGRDELLATLRSFQAGTDGAGWIGLQAVGGARELHAKG